MGRCSAFRRSRRRLRCSRSSARKTATSASAAEHVTDALRKATAEIAETSESFQGRSDAGSAVLHPDQETRSQPVDRCAQTRTPATACAVAGVAVCGLLAGDVDE